MKCKARITKEYKTVKADCIWPVQEPLWGEEIGRLHPEAEKYPVCDGDLSIELEAVDEPDWGGSYATLELDVTCSRCKFGWFSNYYKVKSILVSSRKIDVEALLGMINASD